MRRKRFRLVRRQVLDDRQQRSPGRGDISGRDAAQRHLVHILGQRHELVLQRAAFGRQVDVDLLAAHRARPAHDVADFLHRAERRERGRLHDARLVAQLALRQAVALPEHHHRRNIRRLMITVRQSAENENAGLQGRSHTSQQRRQICLARHLSSPFDYGCAKVIQQIAERRLIRNQVRVEA